MSEARDVLARLAQVRDLAERTVYPRHRFRGFYDAWAAQRRLPGAPANFVLSVIAGPARADLRRVTPPLDPASDADALTLALLALGGADHAMECVVAAIASGLFDAPGAGPEDRGALTDRWSAALGVRDGRMVLQRSRREALTEMDATWADPGNLLPAMVMARRRLCRLTSLDSAENPVSGTGFLIGPAAVLTNLHVVDHLIEADGTVQAPGGAEFTVRFDFSETAGIVDGRVSIYHPAERWLISSGALHPEGRDGRDRWWLQTDQRRAWLQAVAGELDYAVIALDGTPGLQRGWYDLAATPRGKIAQAWLMHHPGGEGHTITQGPVRFTRAGARHIFHRADSAGGSSGGLLLDELGRPAGLHYMALEPDDYPAPGSEQDVLNVAVSLRAVAEDLEAKDALAAVRDAGGVRPFRGMLDGVRPVFGRADFLGKLERLWRGDAQVMLVHVRDLPVPLNRPGKSFTLKVIKSIFRPPENHHVVFRAGEVASDAAALAAATVQTFAPDLIATMPDVSQNGTPEEIRRLVTWVAQAAEARLSSGLVWVMLDDLDKHDLSDASGREFLSTVYSQIRLMPKLRIVLVGLPEGTSLPGLNESDVLRSSITDDEVRNIGRYFTDWLKERGARETELTDYGYEFFADIVTSFAGSTAPLEELSEFVARFVSPAAERRFGGVAGGSDADPGSEGGPGGVSRPGEGR